MGELISNSNTRLFVNDVFQEDAIIFRVADLVVVYCKQPALIYVRVQLGAAVTIYSPQVRCRIRLL